MRRLGDRHRFEQKRREIIIKLAREQHEVEGDLEFDNDPSRLPTISEGDDNGAYVHAWVWVSFVGTEIDKEPD
jgi:hypothetical protein